MILFQELIRRCRMSWFKFNSFLYTFLEGRGEVQKIVDGVLDQIINFGDN